MIVFLIAIVQVFVVLFLTFSILLVLTPDTEEKFEDKFFGLKLLSSLCLSIGLVTYLCMSEVSENQYKELKDLPRYSSSAEIKDLIKKSAEDGKISEYESMVIKIKDFVSGRERIAEENEESLKVSRTAFLEEVKKSQQNEWEEHVEEGEEVVEE